jgi:hypothetical protein
VKDDGVEPDYYPKGYFRKILGPGANFGKEKRTESLETEERSV